MSSFTNYFLSKFFVFDFFLWLNLICMRFALAFMSKYVPQVVCVTAHQFSVLFNFRLFLFLLCFRCARVGRRNLNVYYQCQLIFSFSFLFFFFSPHALQPHWNEKNCPLPQLTQLASQWTKYIYMLTGPRAFQVRHMFYYFTWKSTFWGTFEANIAVRI